jgi:hypothetical protein
MKIKRFVMVSALTLGVAVPQLLGGQVADATGTSSSGGWLLAGTAYLATDPENSANDVVKIRTDPNLAPFFGQVSRTVNVKIDKLDNMLEFKARFSSPTKSCAVGTPSMQLVIDTDGDGEEDGVAFGTFGAPPTFIGCPMNTWLYEDFTGPGDGLITGGLLSPSAPPSPPPSPPNEEFEWNLVQFDVTLPPQTWSQVEAFFAAFPNHKVCTVALVDALPTDLVTGLPLPIIPGSSGTAHYDLISGGRATWVDGSDIAGRGIAQGCGRLDLPGDGHTHDQDHDGDYDSDDVQYHQYRKQKWGNG